MTEKKKKELSEEELEKASGGFNVNITPLGGHDQTSPTGAPGTMDPGGSGSGQSGPGASVDPLGDHDQATPQQRRTMNPRQQP